MLFFCIYYCRLSILEILLSLFSSFLSVCLSVRRPLDLKPLFYEQFVLVVYISYYRNTHYNTSQQHKLQNFTEKHGRPGQGRQGVHAQCGSLLRPPQQLPEVRPTRVITTDGPGFSVLDNPVSNIRFQPDIR